MEKQSVLSSTRLFDKAKVGQFLNSRVGDLLFLSAFFLYLSSRVMEYSFLTDLTLFSMLSFMFRLLSMAFITGKIFLFSSYTPSFILVSEAILVILGISRVTAGSAALLMVGLFAICAANVDYRKICDVGFFAVFITVTIVMICSYFGVIRTNTTFATSVAQDLFGVEVRNSYGFIHVNCVGQMFLALLLCRTIRTKALFSRTEIVAWILVAAFLFFAVNTKTIALLILIPLIFQPMVRIFSNKISCRIIMFVACAAMAAGFMLVFNFDQSNGLFSGLNYLLANRLSYAHTFLERYPLTLFGQQLSLVSTEEANQLGIQAQILDNAYINILLRFGMLAVVLVMVCIFVCAKEALDNMNCGLMLAIAILCISGISETWILSIPGLVIFSRLFAVQNDS